MLYNTGRVRDIIMDILHRVSVACGSLAFGCLKKTDLDLESLDSQ